MRVLVCNLGIKEESLIAFKFDDIRATTLSVKLIKPPVNDERVLGGISYEGEMYTAISFHALFDEKIIKVFVLLKNGYAVGVSEIITTHDTVDLKEVKGDLRKYFKYSFNFHDHEVFLIDNNSFANIPKIPKELVLYEGKNDGANIGYKKKSLIEEFIVIKCSGKKYATSVKELQEVVDSKRLNLFKEQGIIGFVESRGTIFPVFWKDQVSIEKIKWVIVLGDFAIPMEEFDIVKGELIKGKDEIFVRVEGENIPYISKKDF